MKFDKRINKLVIAGGNTEERLHLDRWDVVMSNFSYVQVIFIIYLNSATHKVRKAWNVFLQYF